MSGKTSLEYASFNPQSNEFTAENALFMIKNARLAYESKELIQHVVQEIWQYPGYSFIEYISDEDDVPSLCDG